MIVASIIRQYYRRQAERVCGEFEGNEFPN